MGEIERLQVRKAASRGERQRACDEEDAEEEDQRFGDAPRDRLRASEGSDGDQDGGKQAELENRARAENLGSGGGNASASQRREAAAAGTDCDGTGAVAVRDSHFISAALSAGCETSRCQTRAWNDSV